jgi:geranylgeranyl pyrophosphate synthase
MDLYQSTVDYLLSFPIFDAWHEMRTILQRVAAGRPRDWQLPIMACQAVGASAEQAFPASAALACAQIGIILVDDMLDDDPRGEYHRVGSGRAANFALAFQAAGFDALMGSKANSSVKWEALNSLRHMMLTTAYGQELDVQNPGDEISYWRVVENKSGPFFGSAIHLGALLGEATIKTADKLKKLGNLYGEMIQIYDDLNDTMAVPANPDWLQKRKPLPILFALSVNHPERTRFEELYNRISAGNALHEAQEILIRCGALSYCVDQLLRRHQAAQNILNETPLSTRQEVDSLLKEVIAPVWKLFAALGLSPEVPSTIAAPLNRE